MSSPEDKQYYSFNWNNHMRHIRGALTTLLNESVLVDVTLCCEGGRLSAHKILLSMCSPYFRDVFKENPCPHPIVILKGVSCGVMQELLQFIYDGEVTVDYGDFTSFIKTAELLQICGLTEEVEEGKEFQNGYKETRMEASAVQKGKRRTDGTTELDTVKKKKEVEVESSISDINRVDTTTECLYNEAIIVDASDNSEINVKNEGALQEGGIVEFVNEVEDIDADPVEEQIKPLPLGDRIEELDFKKVEGLLDGKPSVSTLHLHRCFSSTAVPKKAPGVKHSSRTNRTATQYLCTICGKLFAHEKSYEQHKNVHTGRTKCPICNKILCRKYQLKIHLQRQHKDENLSVDDIVPLLDTVEQKTRGKVRSFRYFKCSECNKEYSNEKSLRQHMWMHKGRTRCHICDKVLGRKYELKVHLKSTHGITNL